MMQLRAFSYFEGIYGADPNRVTVTRPDQLEEMVQRCQDALELAGDTETNGLRWDLHCHAIGHVYACPNGAGEAVSYYVPFRHRTGEQQVSEEAALAAQRRIRQGARQGQVTYWWNLPFDKHICRKDGVELTPGRDLDAQIDARLLDENTGASLKERALADLGDVTAHVQEQLVGREIQRLATLHGLGKTDYKDRHGYEHLPIFLAGAYATYDGLATLRLAQHYNRKGVRDYYSRSPRGPWAPGIWHTEQQLAHVLVDIEEWGVPVDRQYLYHLREITQRAAAEIESRIWDAVGHHRRFNLDSDDELRHFLVRVLGLPLYRKTRGGDLSVGREVLEEFAGDFPPLALIKDRREASKISSTYTDSLLRWCDRYDYIHGKFRQMGTDTGRAAMTEPNLQNICSDDDARAQAFSGKKLEDGGIDPWSTRRGFVCRPGYVRLLVDWSQVQLRILADASGDPQLVNGYRTPDTWVDGYRKSGFDVHDHTTKLIWGKVEKSKRRTSKEANFGTAFGLTPIGLARRARIPEHEAEAFYQRYWQEYAGVARFRRELWRQAREAGGYITNKFGRTRRVPEILSMDPRTRESAERVVIASKIQGEEGDVTKDAMVRLDRRLKAESLDAHICLWVHDEVGIDVRPQDFARVALIAKAEMEHFPDYAVPITTSVEYTDTNLAEKRKVRGI